MNDIRLDALSRSLTTTRSRRAASRMRAWAVLESLPKGPVPPLGPDPRRERLRLHAEGNDDPAVSSPTAA